MDYMVFAWCQSGLESQDPRCPALPSKQFGILSGAAAGPPVVLHRQSWRVALNETARRRFIAVTCELASAERRFNRLHFPAERFDLDQQRQIPGKLDTVIAPDQRNGNQVRTHWDRILARPNGAAGQNSV